MIIGTDSPLRRIPAQLDPKQVLFFDGIRYSIDMAAMAHLRLKETLGSLTNVCVNRSNQPIASEFVLSILDAWSIVDSVHRLRKLIGQTPRFKQNTPDYQLFFRNTSTITELRDFVQHLDERVSELINQNTPVWGALSWFKMSGPECKSGFTCTLIAGTIFKNMEELLVNPLGKELSLPIDMITLTAGGYSICLSDVMRQVERLTRYLEGQLGKQHQGLPPKQEDILACAEIEFGTAQ